MVLLGVKIEDLEDLSTRGLVGHHSPLNTVALGIVVVPQLDSAESTSCGRVVGKARKTGDESHGGIRVSRDPCSPSLASAPAR